MPRRALLPIVVTALVAVGVGAGGCGSDSASSTAPAATTTEPGAPGSVSAAVGGAVPLGISPTQLEKRLGAPAIAPEPAENGLRCSFYRIAEEPPFVKLRYCFLHGHLKFFSTYAVEGSSG